MLVNRALDYEVESTQPVLGKTAVSVYNVSHTMRMLAETTYAKPVEAVVRETIANALDACRNRVPIKIITPNLLEPNFKVRDFGTGMTEEFFLDGYSKLGYSTKSASNDAIGGWGQGRFAPFAYKGCDVFYVRSVKDGQFFVGTIERNADFEVFVSIQTRGETEEPNGTEIIIPVLHSDHIQFREAIAKYTEFLDPKPDCSVPPDETPALLEGDGWRITRIANYQGTKFRAVMGGIPYAFDNSICLMGEVNGADLMFEIGELAVSNSRESLRYDDATKKAIKARIEEIKKELTVRQAARIAQLKTKWEEWTDSELVQLNSAISYHTTKTLEFRAISGVLLAHDLAIACESNGLSRKIEKRIRLAPNNRFTFYVADHPKWRSRYVEHLESLIDATDNQYVVVVKYEGALNAFGNPPFIKCSELPEPKKEIVARHAAAVREKRTTKMFEFSCDEFREIKADFSGHKIYVPLAVTKVTEELQKAFELYPCDKSKLVGVPKADWKLAEKAGWTRFDDHFRQQITPEMVEGYTYWLQTLRMPQVGLHDALSLAQQGFQPPPFMVAAYNVFRMLRLIVAHRINFALMKHLGCPPNMDDPLSFKSMWKDFGEQHPILARLLNSSVKFSVSEMYRFL